MHFTLLALFLYLNNSLQAPTQSRLLAWINAANKLINKKNFHFQPVNSSTQNCIQCISFVKMLTFCWICFLLLLIIQYIYINPFHDRDLMEASWNHTMKRFNCLPCRPSNCSCNVFTKQPWNKAELSSECRYVFNQQQEKKSKYCLFASCEAEKNVSNWATF